MYQIGRAESPENDDPYYDTEAEALEAAKRAATGDLVYAIWRVNSEDEADFTTLYLIYQNDVWRLA